METSNEQLISLLVAKELQLREMTVYVNQLEREINELSVKYNELYVSHYKKVEKRKVIGFKQGG